MEFNSTYSIGASLCSSLYWSDQFFDMAIQRELARKICEAKGPGMGSHSQYITLSMVTAQCPYLECEYKAFEVATAWELTNIEVPLPLQQFLVTKLMLSLSSSCGQVVMLSWLSWDCCSGVLVEKTTKSVHSLVDARKQPRRTTFSSQSVKKITILSFTVKVRTIPSLQKISPMEPERTQGGALSRLESHIVVLHVATSVVDFLLPTRSILLQQSMLTIAGLIVSPRYSYKCMCYAPGPTCNMRFLPGTSMVRLYASEVPNVYASLLQEYHLHLPHKVSACFFVGNHTTRASASSASTNRDATVYKGFFYWASIQFLQDCRHNVSIIVGSAETNWWKLSTRPFCSSLLALYGLRGLFYHTFGGCFSLVYVVRCLELHAILVGVSYILRLLTLYMSSCSTLYNIANPIYSTIMLEHCVSPQRLGLAEDIVDIVVPQQCVPTITAAGNATACYFSGFFTGTSAQVVSSPLYAASSMRGHSLGVLRIDTGYRQHYLQNDCESTKSRANNIIASRVQQYDRLHFLHSVLVSFSAISRGCHSNLIISVVVLIYPCKGFCSMLQMHLTVCSWHLYVACTPLSYLIFFRNCIKDSRCWYIMQSGSAILLFSSSVRSKRCVGERTTN